MTDEMTFACVDCGAVVTYDRNRPPKDDDIIDCKGCGREFGTYAKVREAMVDAGKKRIDDLVMSKFGTKPKWTKS